MKQIRICHLVYSFDEIGGLENGLINIINNTDQRRFHHVICALTRCGDIKKRVTNKAVEYVSLNKKEGNDFLLPISLGRIFRKSKIDIVHLRNWPTMLEGYVAARMSGIQSLIYSEHGRHFEEIDEGKKIKYRVKQFIFRKVPLLLTVSSEVGKEMKVLYKLNRPIKVIRNGVDTLRFCPIPRETISQVKEIGSKKPVIGTVCRLVKGKSLPELITAFAENNENLKLVIIGEGPERPVLEDLIKTLDCSANVRLLGNRGDVPELLNCIDVFLQPSESEGLSNVVIEAMACGLPVVAFDVGGNRELIEHGKGGFLAKLYNMDMLLSFAYKLARDRNLSRSMGMFNYETIQENFTISLMVEKYSQMYENLFLNSNGV